MDGRCADAWEGTIFELMAGVVSAKFKKKVVHGMITHTCAPTLGSC